MGFSSTIGRPGEGPGLGHGRGIRVMVVDDSLIVRSAFSRLIEQEEALVLSAAVSTADSLPCHTSSCVASASSDHSAEP